MNPIQEKYKNLIKLDWNEFFKELPKWLYFKSKINKSKNEFGYLYSYYIDATDWSIWLEVQ